MFTVSSFYRFSNQTPAELAERRTRLEQLGPELSLVGLVILAAEGCNGTVAGAEPDVTRFETELTRWNPELSFKRSRSPRAPFRKWKVDLRPEAVSAGAWAPPPPGRNHLSPAAWHEAVQNPEAVVLDVRNRYEIEVGSFPGAVDPMTDTFGQFERFLETTDLPRDRPLLTYCTGGIRCEKALGALERAGFQQVYQLEGGILRYLEHYPEGHFRGECYVFDDRVAVDAHLEPTQRWAHCPHCGVPCDYPSPCSVCGEVARVCPTCLERGQTFCSKVCRGRAFISRQR